MSYLRLPRADFEAIVKLCRPVKLTEGFFPVFKFFLVEALADSSRELAARVAQLHGPSLRLLFNRLRDLLAEPPAETRHGLTPEESAAFAAACRALTARCRSLRHFREFLVLHFEEASPALAKKLARLSRRQFERLYGQVSEQSER